MARKRTVQLLQDCVDVLESADIEDSEALIGQLKAEIAQFVAKAQLREAFSDNPTSVKPKPKSVKAKPAKASKPKAKPAFIPSTVPTAA